MRILFLPAYFYPESYSSGHLDNDLYEYFSSLGIKMLAYVPSPSRGIDKSVRTEYRSRKVEKLFDGNFELHRFKLIKEPNGTIKRAIRYLLAVSIQFFKGLFARDIDVIFLVSTPPIIGIVGALLHKIKKIPFIYVVQDIFPDSLVNSGLSRKGALAWRIGRVLEKFTYGNATRIIVISQDFKNNLLEKEVPEEKIEIIYNWIDTTSIIHIERDKNFLITDWNLDPLIFYVVYAGNFGNAQDVNTIVESAQLLKNDNDIQFLLVGGGSQEEALKKFVEYNKLQNVKFFPMQSAEILSYVYSIGDVGVVCCKQGMGKNAFPSKTWSYLAAGTPIIASYDLDSELSQMTNSNGIGVAINPENAKQMADAILKLKNSKKLLREMSISAQTFVESHASKNLAVKQYVHVLNSIVSYS